MNASGNLHERELSGLANAGEKNKLDNMASLDIIQETKHISRSAFVCHMFCRGRGLEDEDKSIKVCDWETTKQ